MRKSGDCLEKEIIQGTLLRFGFADHCARLEIIFTYLLTYQEREEEDPRRLGMGT